jgi:Aromatic amino acid lyase
MSLIGQFSLEYNNLIPQRRMSMTITLNGSSLTIEKLVAIARDNEKVELAPEALERIKVCRAMLEDKLAKKEVMYGTNTGIGEFSETMLSDEQVKEFQRYLVGRYRRPRAHRTCPRGVGGAHQCPCAWEFRLQT